MKTFCEVKSLEKLDVRGQTNVAAASIGAIVGVIGIIIFAEVYDSLNTEQVSTSAENLLDLVDLLLAAVLVVGIVALLALTGFARR